MKRFTQCFSTVARELRPAYIPFVMLADPSPVESLTVINAVIDSGIDALELGIPFSDPIADGPIVAQAAARASAHQLSLSSYFSMIKSIREKHPLLPIGLLVYANLVFRYGIELFYQQAKLCGVDAVLIPDLPFMEAQPYLQAAKQYEIEAILMATPACQAEQRQYLAQQGTGFTYLVTRNGVTGMDKGAEFEQAKKAAQALKSLGAPPCVFGFGIKDHEDVQRAYQAGAQGVIIGSALIKAISEIDLTQPSSAKEIIKLTRTLFTGQVC